MNFLNKTKSEAKWLMPVLGLIYALTSILPNYNSLVEMMRSMEVLMGVSMNAGYLVLTLAISAAMSALFYILFLGLAYSIAYRTLVNKTRDIKAMPISKECMTNHALFVMSIANVLLGVISFALRLAPLYATVIDVVVRMLVRALCYVLIVFMLAKVGIGDNVKKKLFGSLLTPFAVLTLLLV